MCLRVYHFTVERFNRLTWRIFVSAIQHITVRCALHSIRSLKCVYFIHMDVIKIWISNWFQHFVPGDILVALCFNVTLYWIITEHRVKRYVAFYFFCHLYYLVPVIGHERILSILYALRSQHYLIRSGRILIRF